MKNKKILGLPIAVFVIGLMIIGGASAALLTVFGQVTVQADVEQAVVIDGDTDITLSNKTGPFSHNEIITVINNNNERDVEYTWKILSSKQMGTLLAVYEISEYNLYEHIYGGDWYVSPEEHVSNYNVKVIPGVDTVTYEIETDEDIFTWANLQISTDDGNYHIGYDGSQFYYKDPSKTADALNAEDSSEFVSGNFDDDVLTITVKRDFGYEQTFMVHVETTEKGYDTLITRNALIEEEHNSDWYQDSGTVHNEEPDMTNFIEEDDSIRAGAEKEYVFSIFVDTNFAGDLYSKVGIEPITFLS